jgi:uncharacterized protein (DUF302 family)
MKLMKRLKKKERKRFKYTLQKIQKTIDYKKGSERMQKIFAKIGVLIRKNGMG